MKSISFDELNVGDTLPPLSLAPINRTSLALFAGASGDLTVPKTSSELMPRWNRVS